MSRTSWITTPVTAGLLRGALELERTEHGVLPHRLPAWARAQCTDGQLAMAEAQPSGVRLVFRTRATAVELDTLRTRPTYPGIPPRADGVYDLLVDGRLSGRATGTGGNVLVLDMATGTAETQSGPVGTVRFSGLPERLKDVEIWLPYNEITELVASAATPPSRRCRRAAAGCGCTTAARSATARTPRAPPRPGRRWPRRSAVPSWSTSAWVAAPCSTRSRPAPSATPQRT